MIFVNRNNIVDICSRANLEKDIAQTKSIRPDFTKIFNEESLGVYACASKLNEKLKATTHAIDHVCIVVPPSGPSNELFKLTEESNQEKIADSFRKMFTPKAHLFFTNSLVGSQIAIDFNYDSEITTINSDLNGNEQLYSFLQLKLQEERLTHCLAIMVFPEKNRIKGLLLRSQKINADDFAIKTKDEFINFILEMDNGQ
ncbi:MAG: hypothetical protein WC635_06955 [Bacteriovorax sp.]|jgi:hypothetical protein